MAIVALAAAALCAVLRCAMGKYVFSACTTILCACAVAASGQVGAKAALIAGLCISVAADWFLAHQKEGGNRFLYGVMGFFAAHCMFAWYALMRFSYNTYALYAALALLVVYILYMALRMLPKTEKGMRIPLSLYVFISIVSAYCAMSMGAGVIEKIVYVVGIFAILFSDTMIGEDEFLGHKAAGKLVLPTYYICHLCLALSAVIR